jgi:serine/threonine protein kinase
VSVPPSHPHNKFVMGSDPAATGTKGMPQRFGKYTLLRKLATGGMAELFLALQKSVAGFEKLIVIKRILPHMNQDAAFIGMLLQEARLAATLSHANIVQIFDVGEVDGVFFIAMEHVHGEDIRSIVRQMKVKNVPDFPREHALNIIIGVCAGLAYAHDKRDLEGNPLNIVHRDISPQNVVVTFSGDIKVVDFGIAKSDVKMQADTKSGKLKGKVPYMSPEQATGDRLDARSDIFSTGVMLFELTTGRRLFKGQSEYETLKLICERDYPRPSQVVPGYPPELEAIVVRALAKDRDQRFQTAGEMRAALEAYVRKERLVVSTQLTSDFMQMLFADKLASQNADLAQGKQMAEIIEASYPTASDAPPPAETAPGRNSGFPSMPPASRTLTGFAGRTFIPQKKHLPFIVGGAAILFLMVGVTSLLLSKPTPKETAPAAALETPAVAAAVTPSVTAAPARGSVALTSDPPGASIWIDGQLQSQITPATLGDLPLGKSLDIKLTKDGYLPEREAVTLDEGNRNATIDKALHPRGGGGGKRAVAPVASTAAAPAEGKAAPGKLNVAAQNGWCNVAVDGKAQGATPVAQIEVGAGTHRVTCTTADGKTQTATVNVPPDGIAKHRFTL